MQHLSGLLEAEMDYHRQSLQILDNLRSSLQSRLESRFQPCLFSILPLVSFNVPAYFILYTG